MRNITIQTLRQLRLRLDQHSGIGRFWLWWSGELATLVPPWLQRVGPGATTVLSVEVTPQAIVLQRWQQQTSIEQDRLDMQTGDDASRGIEFQALFTKLHRHGERVALWVPAAQCLIKRIELPLAAAENLREVIGFEMDRHTPFKAEQVYFDFRILEQDNQNNRLIIKLIAAPRQMLDSSLALLARWGATPQAMYVAETSTLSVDAVDLMPAERRMTRPTKPRWVNRVLPPLTLLLAISAMAIPIWQKRQTLMALLPVVEHAKQQASATEAVRHELEKMTAEHNFMLDKKQATPPVVVLLNELSRLLPDGTWVQQFSLRGKELQIHGETTSSSRLIAVAESSGILHQANFRSPLTKGETANSERYHLVAQVKPRQ